MTSNQFLKIFKERGFFHQATDWDELAKLPNFTAYIGFDCTATSLHVGSLMQIMILRWLKKTGNTPIILLGGGTTKVGDPSGKDETRKILTDADIENNKKGIANVFERFGLSDCKIVDNDEWLGSLKYLEFLRDVGRLFSVNKMLSFDSVKLRLEREQNLSFLEFNYMILQAYDFVKLAQDYNCRVQIGGSDQWGNIVNGTDLYRKLQGSTFSGTRLKATLENDNLFGLTTPLMTTASGAKMGKTADGAVWLDADRVSPYDYYQFWRNTEDADVIKFLKIFTELPLEQIEEYKSWEGSAKINDAKKILAFEATKLCHGEQAANDAHNTAITAFEQGGTAGLPVVTVAFKEYKASELFVAAGLAASNGEAKRLIAGGGAKVNDVKVESDSQIFISASGMKLSSGKKKHIILELA